MPNPFMLFDYTRKFQHTTFSRKTANDFPKLSTSGSIGLEFKTGWLELFPMTVSNGHQFVYLYSHYMHMLVISVPPVQL